MNFEKITEESGSYRHLEKMSIHEILVNINHEDKVVPMAVEKMLGKTKIVATRLIGSPLGPPAFHRIAEVYFPSMQALEACAASEGGKLTIAHALSISSGGTPTILIAEEETFVFPEVESTVTR